MNLHNWHVFKYYCYLWGEAGKDWLPDSMYLSDIRAWIEQESDGRHKPEAPNEFIYRGAILCL